MLLPLSIALLIYILSHELAPNLVQFAGVQTAKSKSKKQKAGAVTHKAAQEQWLMPISALGAVVGFLGSLIAALFLTPQDFMDYVQGAYTTSMLYRQLYELMLSNQLNNLGAPLFIFLTTAFTSGFSFALGFIKKDNRQYASWALVGLTCLVLVSTVLQATGGFRQVISREPADLSYSFDGEIYLKTFYRMADKGFYSGYIEAAANDSRVNKEQSVQDGKFYGYVHSPLYFRTPVIFYVWRIFTFGNAVGVLYLGMIFTCGIIVLAYLAGKSLFGEAGIFLSLVLVPYLILGLIWWNLFFPDWWAALALTAGILFWLRRQYWPAAAAFLVASAFREVVFLFLFLFLILALVQKKEARLPFGAAATTFFVLYSFHFFKAQNFIGLKDQEISSIVSRLSSAHFVPTASYMAFPYGFFLWPPYFLMLVCVVVWAWKRKYDMLALSVLAFPYFAYASSSYWGQHLLPFIIFSAFMVLMLKRDENGEDMRPASPSASQS